MPEESKNNFWMDSPNFYKEGPWESVFIDQKETKVKLIHDTKPEIFIRISDNFKFKSF